MALLALLGLKAKLLLTGIGGSALAGLAIKYGPKWIGREEDKLLAKILTINVADPKEKELILALASSALKLIEYKLPDSGIGDQRKAALETYLVKILPGVAAHVIAELVDQAEILLDKKLKDTGGQPAS